MNEKELLPSTDPQKLRLLATWFDKEQKKRAEWDSTEVQQDLRRMADKIESLEAENARLKQREAELVEALESVQKMILQIKVCNIGGADAIAVACVQKITTALAKGGE